MGNSLQVNGSKVWQVYIKQNLRTWDYNGRGDILVDQSKQDT